MEGGKKRPRDGAPPGAARKKAHKKRRHKLRPESTGQEARARPKAASDENAISYSFPVDALDHCETPLLAYIHLCPLLDHVRGEKARGELRIYDPYFCEGGVVRRLGALGFGRVHNANEDFYENIRGDGVPDFDVLVTNPPYGHEHIQRLLRFASSCGKPFALLMPNWVYAKEYFRGELGAVDPFYLVPKKRYSYVTVKGRHQQKSASKTAPFPSFWYCHAPASPADTVCRALQATVRATLRADLEVALRSGDVQANGRESAMALRIARDLGSLPEDALDHNDPRMKRIRNAKKRKKNKQKKRG